MKAFIFTYPIDYDLSYLAYEALLTKAGVDEVVLVYDQGDVPPDKKYNSIKSTFPRFGNLNGPKFMEGALDLYMANSEGHDEILKVDSDTLVFDLEWTKHPETLVGFRYDPHRAFYGMAYRLKTAALPLIKELLVNSEFPFTYAEDLMIEKLCRELGVYTYDYSYPGEYAGYNWRTKLTSFDYRERYKSVINVYPPEGFSPENSRKLVYTKMRQLLDAK